MNESAADRLSLDVQEISLLYARLKREEDALTMAERGLLRKLELFLYAFLSIETLEALVGGKVGR
jgi:hypothetical protein